jgi:hypothetical protein
MNQPVYKVWLVKGKEAWYALSPEEQNKLMEKVGQTLVEVGGEHVISCSSVWASENYQYWGVDKFPDIEAAQKHAELLMELNWFRYADSTSYLGTKSQES